MFYLPSSLEEKEWGDRSELLTIILDKSNKTVALLFKEENNWHIALSEHIMLALLLLEIPFQKGCQLTVNITSKVHPFIHYLMPGTPLSSGDNAVNKTDKICSLLNDILAEGGKCSGICLEWGNRGLSGAQTTGNHLCLKVGERHLLAFCSWSLGG